jgi:hypothetical protein
MNLCPSFAPYIKCVCRYLTISLMLKLCLLVRYAGASAQLGIHHHPMYLLILFNFVRWGSCLAF